MPNQFLSDEFGDIEDYFVTDYWLIDNFVGDQLWVWGAINDGRLGINNAGGGAQNIPVTTFAGGTTWKQVSAGNQHTAAIKTDGSLWIWGDGDFGKLGTNDTTPKRNTPVTTFVGGTDWKQVSCSPSNSTAAIKTDGTLWVWGRGINGVLGINNTDDRSIPVTTFAGGTTWKQVSAGNQHTAAIKTDGSLWTWGRNSDSTDGGNLGTNDNTNRNTPVTTFSGGINWKSVATGNLFTVAIKTDGTLWTWGRGTDGKLGINAVANSRSTPVTTFAGGTNWKLVSCIDSHISAIKTDGSLWTWGLGTSGQLGDNTIITKSTPVTTFAGGNNWKSVAAGGSHTAAIKTDGSLWIWGEGGYGRLGTNNETTRSTPVTTFAGGNNWKQVIVGPTHTAAIKSGLNVDLS